MEDGRSSRTAVLVCQARAFADGHLLPDRFRDPVAGRLLRPDESTTVEQARAPGLPSSSREQFAVRWVRAVAEVVVPRTVAIDDAIDDAVVTAGSRQVVIIGAGLDTRPWRLDALRGAAVYDVDHPATQADAGARSADLTAVAGTLALVPVDLGSDELGPALEAAGHDPAAPTTWVWEGVVPYLTAAEVAGTVGAIAGCSAAGSVLVVSYQARSWSAALGRRVFGLVAALARFDNPLVREPWRSTWTPRALGELLGRSGFRVSTDEDLLTIARRLGSPTAQRGSLANGRVAVATAD